jgi:S-adenosylmethionine/arginine decarboxylase-like enzyme
MPETRKNKKSKHQAWGHHLIINAGNCEPKALRSKAIITAFAKQLVKDIDMVAYGPPRVVMFGEGNTKGYTLVQLISTSNITAHFVEETNDIYLDIFSCKPFDKFVALDLFHKTFHPKILDYSLITRQAKHA